MTDPHTELLEGLYQAMVEATAERDRLQGLNVSGFMTREQVQHAVVLGVAERRVATAAAAWRKGLDAAIRRQMKEDQK
jgi:hypothetical protein